MRKLFAVSMKSCLLLLFMMLWTMSANAIPAKPGLTKQLTLNDGTTVIARLVGDEFGHFSIIAHCRMQSSRHSNLQPMTAMVP